MPYCAFYCCKSTEEVIDSVDAYEIELDWAGNIVSDILRGDGDFFGVTDIRGTTLQFMRSGDQVWMEIPSPHERGSYGKNVPILDVPSIISSLRSEIKVSDFPELTFEAW